jgi:hypothetical protein
MGALLLLDRDQLDHARSSASSARQAAEALFKRENTADIKRSEAAPGAQNTEHKPRFLRALSPAQVHQEKAEVRAAPPAQATSAMPASEITRIRTWLKYGMTVPQVARVYGVAVDVVQRLL